MSRPASSYAALGMAFLFLGTFATGLVLHELNATDPTPLAERLLVILGFTGFQAVGSLIVWLRPTHPVGWLLSAVALLAVLAFTSAEYSNYALFTDPGSLPGGVVTAWFSNWLWFPTIAVADIYVPLLFPTGRLPSPGWRWLGYAGAFLLAAVCVSSAFGPTLELGTGEGLPAIDNPLAIPQIESILSIVLAVSFPALIPVVLLTGLSVILRFRRAHGEERQQLKWFATGVLVLLLSVPVDLASTTAGSVAFGLGLLAVPVSIAIAILRYRLYAIDRIINRTLVYAVLTLSLGAAYFGLVVGLQALLRSVNGGSDLAIALTTLVIAAVFLPARRRVQILVDRRFNRRAYDAARTVDAFSARLREQIDLDTLRYELLSVVDETMQPQRASVWIKGMQQ